MRNTMTASRDTWGCAVRQFDWQTAETKKSETLKSRNAELGYAELSWSPAVTHETRLKYSTLLERFLSMRQLPATFQGPPAEYNSPPHGWYYPWLASTPQE